MSQALPVPWSSWTTDLCLADEHGRYHFPAVTPGQRLVKLNLSSISSEAVATTDETVVLTVTPASSQGEFRRDSTSGTERYRRDKQLGIP